MELVLITGMSGSGKSVALHALEDAGFYCVDNLPPELLLDFVALEKKHHASRIAIAMDVRWMPLPAPWFVAIQKRGANILYPKKAQGRILRMNAGLWWMPLS